MKKSYFLKVFLFVSFIAALFLTGSCKKSSNILAITPPPPDNVVVATPKNLGVYETDSSIYKQLIIGISKIGNKSVYFGLVFDTGSGGMVIDASGIIPSSMVTNDGFTFLGDSIVVNDITITNKTSTIVYGDDCATGNDTVYGNLAYAQVTVGDQNGNIVIQNLPFFLYYKATTSSGTPYPAHEFDVFGVNEAYDADLGKNAYITSPFSYYTFGDGLTRGFKIAALGTSNFSLKGTYENVLTLGLTPTDISASSGFVFNQLYNYGAHGYLPYIEANVTYNSNSFTGGLVFDTGTNPYSFLEDSKNGSSSATLLRSGSPVSIATKSGFDYSYTTSSTENLTNVEGSACVDLSIIGIEFFLNNEYMYDFDHHILGLKNN